MNQPGNPHRTAGGIAWPAAGDPCGKHPARYSAGEQCVVCALEWSLERAVPANSEMNNADFHDKYQAIVAALAAVNRIDYYIWWNYTGQWPVYIVVWTCP